MTEREIAKYDFEYSGVLCTGIKWRYPEPNIFYFTKDGKEYEFTQTEDVDCIADTDHIRCVIEYQFLPWLKDEHIKELESENAALRERLEKTVELPARVMIERTIVNGKFKPTQKAQAFNGRIGVVYRDETRYKGLLVDICSEKVSDYEAAEARLAELKGGKKDD